MKIPRNQPPNDNSSRPKEMPYQEDDLPAWEQATEDLWVPFRIRGSWRGGVLG